jgi:hypothetical protein
MTRLALAASLAFGATAATAQTVPLQEQLLQKVEALTQELERVKAQLQQMQAVQQAQAQQAASTTRPRWCPNSRSSTQWHRPATRAKWRSSSFAMKQGSGPA